MQLSFGQRMLLGLYGLVLRLAFPVTLYHLIWRGLRQREYLRRWSERYGWLEGQLDLHDTLWVHAVSVGEVIAARPLVDGLLARHPERPVLVTTITPTGSERVRALWGERVHHVYVPYDLRSIVRRFLDRARPALAVIVETEIWPNLYVECERRGIPLVMVNARLSERSLRGYLPVRALVRLVMRTVDLVAAQSRADAARLERLGADPARIVVTGNLKYDLPLAPGLDVQAQAWRAGWGGARPVWMAASTHAPEEAAVIAAHQALLSTQPDALLLWAPRHPERFGPVAAAARDAGLEVATRSGEGLPGAGTQVFVVDTIGELMGFYAASDVAFVGGSLCEVGGHNVLEPAALGVPSVVGPHTFNFKDVTRHLREAGGLQQVDDADAMAAAVRHLLRDPAARRERGDASRRAVAELGGAVARTLDLADEVLAGRR
ncbi:MAG: 3-deoxy-D-manno-octulosonic acid transferase [Arenimonas sp. SCN 70-307]|uniref:lipid IV(A) 3-deoxy-D-manno-octulosonic acid transferase n=1 Tax=Arenimonas sp. SCN 70-307 TaxID=1660089 RepID=UPI000869B51A|nr:lipid IV(A) 3-deoxy-D-manno-octulosonic acid transferase [Arenimonas sp. SCN 70-307]ODS61492.1 MAG: 3-deoxy-D-manno-octulosonic acid transferase [Arenimonas sp. SCN 70-307]